MAQDTPWISVGELAQAFEPDSNALPRSQDLAGRTLSLHLEDGRVVEHRFETDRLLTWRVLAGASAGKGAEESYLATRVRDEVYLVDFLKHRERATSVTLVLDLSREIFTAVIGRLPDEAEARRPLLDRVGDGLELTAVGAAFVSGAVNRPFSPETARHGVTDELVGKRVEYTYSPTERYEHVYLNENLYTWQCLLGSEKGLADTDRCHYYKLAEQLFLFVWREKIIPTLGVVVVDLERMKTTGKIFGYENRNFGKVSNFPVGAHARLLNVTARD